ncbi:M4 family metallopeptidase [Clostridium butanoliproducens]|uniref:M4 family metallopeptidase n=1 Tax=Clostridium butanoliproducens TaxID=2991837 RepID=UPI0024BB3726|nr:M4 family metallopeptidase [Clostridium butanoliproducens]
MLRKKTLSIIILSSILVNTVSSAALARPIENENEKAAQIEEITKEKFTFLNKEFKEVVTNEDEAEAFLMKNKDLLGKTTGTFEVVDTEKDELGYTHFRTIMTGDGIPVYGSDVVLHVNKNNKVYAINGMINENVLNKEWSKLVKISQETALKIAKDILNVKDLPKDANINPELYIYEHEGNFYVAYLVELLTLEDKPTSWQVFVNAENGEIINKLAFVQNAAPAKGTGVDLTGKTVSINTYEENGKYYLKDTTRLSNGSIITFDLNNISENSYFNSSSRGKFNGTVVSSPNNVFNTERMKAAVSAHNNVAKVVDYYKTEFNRDGIDGRGSDVKIGIHLDNKYNNAFWDPSVKAMVFGDGDGRVFSSLAEALDVTAHETTHGVIDSTSKLLYQNQSGALNEALADIMGVACENEPGDWQIGEDVYTPNTPGDALRDMQDPTKYGQPDHFRDYPGDVRYPSQYNDYGGVHTYSGIILKAAYNIGSQIGMREMGRLFYRANHYFTSKTTFAQARVATLQAAADLYGQNSNEYRIVGQAFDAVGIR